MSNVLYKGIDVSHHNGVIDWKKVKNNGIDFAIIRAGYGQNTIDKQFKYNIENALKNNIKVGLYWFGYAYNIDMAMREAEFFCNLIEEYKGRIDFPIFYDWEYDSYNYSVKHGVKPDKQLVTNIVKSFLEVVKRHGWYVGNYTNIDYINRFFNDEIVKLYDIWLAEWRKNKSRDCHIWQYGAETNYHDNKTVDGINGIVDKNYCYVDYPALIRKKQLNGYKTEKEFTAYDALKILQKVVGLDE